MKRYELTWIKDKLGFLLVVAVLVLLVPFIVSIFYTVSAADDFNYAVRVINAASEGSFFSPIKAIIDFYNNWQGAWFSNIVALLLNPLVWGNVKVLRLFLILIFCALLVASYFCVRCMIEYLNLDNKYIGILWALIVVPVLWYKEYYEIYLWWDGAAEYAVPFLCFLIGLGLLLKYFCNNDCRYFIGATILLFLTSGGMINQGCLLLISSYGLVVFELTYKKNPDSKRLIILIVIITVGFLLTLLAPGNFSRLTAVDAENEKLSLVNVVLYTGAIILQDIERLFLRTSFLVFPILTFLIFALKKINCKIENLICILLLLMFSVYGGLLPVVFGYNAQGISVISNRALFFLDITIMSFSMVFALLLGYIFHEKCSMGSEKVVKIIVPFAIVIVFVFNTGTYNERVPLNIIKNLQTGYIQDYSERWMGIYKEIEESDKADVVIKRDPVMRRVGCNYAWLLEDPETWVNCSVADYYGKESVSLVGGLYFK